MTTYTLSIDAQICEHMAWELNQSGFQTTLVATAETDKASMSVASDVPKGTATRTYLPEYDHDFPQEYRVSFYAESCAQTRLTRNHFQEDYLISMVLFKRIDVGDERSRVTIEGDKVLKLADEIRKWFERIGPDGAEIQNGDMECWCARWLGVTRETIYGLSEVNEFHVIYVPMSHRWRLIRGLARCGEI